eukprot:1382273-Amorphochlora_amoeboformis.AAC.1
MDRENETLNYFRLLGARKGSQRSCSYRCSKRKKPQEKEKLAKVKVAPLTGCTLRLGSRLGFLTEDS